MRPARFAGPSRGRSHEVAHPHPGPMDRRQTNQQRVHGVASSADQARAGSIAGRKAAPRARKAARVAHKTRCKMSDETSGSLTVTRKPGEAVVVDLPDGQVIEIKLTEIRATQVRLKVTAPLSLPIRRTQRGER